MKTVSVVEVKSHLSALLAEVERGNEIAITRHGRVIARLTPEGPRRAADVFRSFWPDAAEIDFAAPPDVPPEPVDALE